MERLRVLWAVSEVFLNDLKNESSDELMHVVIAVKLLEVVDKALTVVGYEEVLDEGFESEGKLLAGDRGTPHAGHVVFKRS